VLECVVNVSEGRDRTALEAITGAAGADLLDVHSDEHHNRSVLTLIGEDAPRRVAREAIVRLDLTGHEGAHPRLGVVDVVPFVPLDGSSMDDARRARDDFAAWLATEHAVPVFLYGDERSLPEIRRHAFRGLSPDVGPPTPHPTAGAACVGNRPLLVAYNLWLGAASIGEARRIAASIRCHELRALGLEVGDGVQVSMNLVAPEVLGPREAYDLVSAQLRAPARIERAELVGLVPETVIEDMPAEDRLRLGLPAEATIEARLQHRG
jgi:glutamate formiminotransferase